MVVAPNTPMFADALQAIGAVQAIVVPVNIRLIAAEVEYLLENSGATFVLVDSEFAHLVAGTSMPVVVCEDSGAYTDPYEAFLRGGEEYDVANGDLGWSGLEFQTDELATFAICYTSGTTSRPKGVETTLRGTYLAAIANAVESGMNSESRYLWILPMFHCLGWTFFAACNVSQSTQVCLRSVGDYSEVWKGFLERGITHYCGAPTVQLAIASHAMARKPPQAITTCIAGAAPTATLIKSLESLGIMVTHVYGLTETYGPLTKTYFIDPASPDYYKLKARQGAGFLTADDIRVVRLIPEGEEPNIKEGGLVETRLDGLEVGEIVMRGNIVMKGYWRNPKATAEAFAGGWFHTGDLAVRFPDGTFAIQDRSKDIIISGGENISSLSVEAELSSHPDVHEIAVVARAHEKFGERPHAFVVLKDGAKWHGKHADFEGHLKKFAKTKMPGFAVPEWIEVVPELEKTSTGKVQKKVLREQLKKRLGGAEK